MVCCGTSGLFGGRRVVVPLGARLADNILMLATPVCTYAIFFFAAEPAVRGFFAATFILVDF